MRSRHLGMTFALVCIGCVSSHSLDDDAGSATDAGVRDGASSDAASSDAGVRFTTRPTHPDGSDVVFCGGVACAIAEACCLATLECHDAAVAGSCPPPPPPEPGVELPPCSSTADCAPQDYCAPGSICGGSGSCVARPSREECPATIAEGHPATCGCDGVTYQHPCEAALHGVAAPFWSGACGEPVDDGMFISCVPGEPTTCAGFPGTECVPFEAPPRSGYSCEPLDPAVTCTRDAHCPAGKRCCEWLALCLPADRADACDAVIGEIPCDVNADCDLGLGVDTLPLYCAGTGCGIPGTCQPRTTHCGGELDPVCGCDGVDYQNPCEAARISVRIDHLGTCAP